MNPASEAELIEALGLNRARDHLDPVGRLLTSSLERQSVQRLLRHGRFPDWWKAVSELAVTSGATVDLNRPAPRVTGTGTIPDEQLFALGPWKKGPFEVCGTLVDAEWRSDLKWSRVQDVATPLAGRRVLDVGTGNGYFLLRAAGDGARFTLGLEPSAHYCAQYLAIQKLYRTENIALLPATSSEFSQDCRTFDTVLSMGVLYHRRSPLDHLMELKGFLRPGGQLILETIVVPGEEGFALLPPDRYAQMRNVWFLPSVPTLTAWLRRLGFSNIVTTEPVMTTPEEQRTTRFAPQPSLVDFLAPGNPSLTKEGHPAPRRVIWVAVAD